MDGVFRSWAITKGPSLDPHDKRLAVEVEDHPLDYGDFEGTIPEGQYGGGTVQLWDRGYWSPEGMTPEEGLSSGDLKFTLDGGHLRGSWVLVRIKNWSGGKRVNWLLIKHRDEFAREGDNDNLLADDRSIASGRSMADIAAGKGRPPKPFMVPGSVGGVASDAVWDSSVGLAPALRKKKTAHVGTPVGKSEKRAAPTATRIVKARAPKAIKRPTKNEG
jgi:bifunctional non-homologous end joining protein LigD